MKPRCQFNDVEWQATKSHNMMCTHPTSQLSESLCTEPLRLATALIPPPMIRSFESKALDAGMLKRETNSNTHTHEHLIVSFNETLLQKTTKAHISE